MVAVSKKLGSILESIIGKRYVIVPSIDGNINISCLNKEDKVFKIEGDTEITTANILNLLNKDKK